MSTDDVVTASATLHGGPADVANAEDSDDDDDDDDEEMPMFDLDAQINAAIAPATQTSPPSPSLQTPSGRVQPPPPSSGMPGQLPELFPSLQQPSSLPPPLTEAGASSRADEHNDLSFDINAMLAAALGQATSQVEAEQQLARVASSVTAPAFTTSEADLLPASSAMGAGSDMHVDLDAFLRESMRLADEESRIESGGLGGEIEGEDSDSESEEDEDDDDGPAFDMDAQLREAMQAQEFLEVAAGGGLTGVNSDEDEEDEEGDDDEFDLDAQIGAAMGSGLHDRAQREMPIDKPPSGVTAADLQALLSNAMQQATMEIDMDEEAIEAAEGDDLMGQVAARVKPFVMPLVPRIKPSLEDDGDPENAFNRSRQLHYQALPFAYACGFQGCDRVVSHAMFYCLRLAGSSVSDVPLS